MTGGCLAASQRFNVDPLSSLYIVHVECTFTIKHRSEFFCCLSSNAVPIPLHVSGPDTSILQVLEHNAPILGADTSIKFTLNLLVYI